MTEQSEERLREQPIVFLDRDGTINVDTGYIHEPEKLQLFPGAGDAVAALKKAGFAVIIVSNQSAVGRGMATIVEVEATNDALRSLLLAENSEAVVDRIVYCPHHPDDECECRKPKTGLLGQIRAQWKVDPANCWVVGDKLSDLLLGENLSIPSAQCLLVLTGDGAPVLERLKETSRPLPSYCKDLAEAAQIIIQSAR